MINFGIKNYEDFKKVFVREDGKRQNKILLDFQMSKPLREYLRGSSYYHAFRQCTNMADLFALCDFCVRHSGVGAYNVRIMDGDYRSDLYSTDAEGICVDGDFRSYRYANMEREGTIYKMKIGKMYKHLILSTEFGKHLPESTILYMCEEMTNKWMAYSASRCPSYELHVDDKFWKIYSSDECTGGFGSCMQDGSNYHFYEESVKAKAAYLTNAAGLVVARCVIYTEVFDEEGNKYRLAERQYSSDGDDVLKRMLVYALIKDGHIDGYKKVGAGCHDPELWLDVNDAPMQNTRFSIRCNLNNGDYVSYQDSFKWYDKADNLAYNHSCDGDLEELLSTTDEYFGGNWDEYHEEYTDSDLTEVYYNGRAYMCSEDNMEMFEWVTDRGEYHHMDDVTRCEECDNYVLNDDAIYSELTGAYYCCDDCLCNAEQDWKERNWRWSDYDNDYFECVEKYHQWDGEAYVLATISEDSLEDLIDCGEVVERNGEYYDSPENLDKEE